MKYVRHPSYVQFQNDTCCLLILATVAPVVVLILFLLQR